MLYLELRFFENNGTHYCLILYVYTYSYIFCNNVSKANQNATVLVEVSQGTPHQVDTKFLLPIPSNNN